MGLKTQIQFLQKKIWTPLCIVYSIILQQVLHSRFSKRNAKVFRILQNCMVLEEKWYFVFKIVLTYCDENKLFKISRTKFFLSAMSLPHTSKNLNFFVFLHYSKILTIREADNNINSFNKYSNNLADFNSLNKKILPKNSSQKNPPKNFLPKNSSQKIPPPKTQNIQKNSKTFLRF